MSFQDERVQFAAVIAATAIYLALGQLTPDATDLLSAGEPPPPGDDPLPTYLLLIVATGAAFAPRRWREVAPLAGVATAVAVIVLLLATLMAGRIPGVLTGSSGVVWQVLIGLYVMHFLCLSIGFAIFWMIRRPTP